MDNDHEHVYAWSPSLVEAGQQVLYKWSNHYIGMLKMDNSYPMKYVGPQEPPSQPCLSELSVLQSWYITTNRFINSLYRYTVTCLLRTIEIRAETAPYNFVYRMLIVQLHSYIPLATPNSK